MIIALTGGMVNAFVGKGLDPSACRGLDSGSNRINAAAGMTTRGWTVRRDGGRHAGVVVPYDGEPCAGGVVPYDVFCGRMIIAHTVG